MDVELVSKGFQFSRRKKKLLFLLAAFGVSGYGVYKVYNFPSVAKKRKRLLKLMGALFSVIEMVSDSAEAIGVVSKDMKEFLQSDSDQIPHSLTQLSKITRSNEFSTSLMRVSEAVTLGILRGYREGIENDDGGGISGFAEKVIDKMTNKAGTGFVSVIAGSFAKNLVLGFRTNRQPNGDCVGSDFPEWVVDVLCNESCKVVMADYIKTFVSTAVAVYLDKTTSVNVYDDMFSGLTNPKHQAQVRDVLVSVCNGAVETLVKTSHQVLTRPHSSASCTIVDNTGSSSTTVDTLFDQNARKLQEKISSFDIQNSGWVSSFQSTLSVPSNRRFVLGMTRRVTYETTRSFMAFFLRKLMYGLSRGFNLVHDKVMERGFEVIQYVGAKSFVIVTTCLALYVLCILYKQLPFVYM